MLLTALVRLLANAIGLLVAGAIVDGLHLDAKAFVIAVLIFTVVEVVAEPLLRQIAVRNVPVLMGSVSLVTTFVGLLITDLLSVGLSISGVSAWLFSTVIVWIAALIAGLILPLLLLRRAVDDRRR